MRLVSTLERLLGKSNSASSSPPPHGFSHQLTTLPPAGQNDLLLLSTLSTLQGILLLHPPSRTLFAREIHMNLLLDLLDPSCCPAIQSTTLLTLVVSLLDHPRNTRCFEALDGLLTVTSLFKQRATSREVKMKLVEFLYFYLMPEGAASGKTLGGVGGEGTRSTEEKQVMLAKYLNNVEDLVEDLRDNAPFGGTVY